MKIFKYIYDIDAAAVLILFGVGELLDDIKSEANCLGISDRIIFLWGIFRNGKNVYGNGCVCDAFTS